MVVVAAPRAARADVPPPSDYKETCTVAQQEGAQDHCELRPAFHGDAWGCAADPINTPPDKNRCGYGGDQATCCNGWLAAGWKYRCKTYGASVFGALWCRPRTAADPARPAAPASTSSSGGCASRSQPKTGQSFGLATLLGLIAVTWLVRRRRS